VEVGWVRLNNFARIFERIEICTIEKFKNLNLIQNWPRKSSKFWTLFKIDQEKLQKFEPDSLWKSSSSKLFKIFQIIHKISWYLNKISKLCQISNKISTKNQFSSILNFNVSRLIKNLSAKLFTLLSIILKFNTEKEFQVHSLTFMPTTTRRSQLISVKEKTKKK
jgi:hypothetical protein